MNNKFQNIFLGIIIVLGIALCAMLLAEGSEESTPTSVVYQTNTRPVSTAPIVNAPTTAEDIQTQLAVITSLNVEGSSISVRTYPDGENLSFITNGSTSIMSAHDIAMTLSQLELGSVVFVTYDGASDKLTEIHLTNVAWEYTKVENITVNQAHNTISFYGHEYQYANNLVVVSGNELITPIEITERDQLRIFELEGKVVSIIVEKGHGYISLTGVDLFEGGYVDIGNQIIKTIEKNMMVLVTEGIYKVQVSHSGYSGSKTVTVLRDQVSIVDFSEIVADTIENGNVFFDIDVDGAELYLNSEETDYTVGVLTLPVGSYSVRVTADGYETYTERIEILPEYQKINIVMTPDDDTAVSQEETTTSTGNTTTTTTATESASVTSQYETETTIVSTINKVYVDEPVGASVYFDGTYIGVAPVNFAMVTGNHIITVLEGTQVRSYSVYLAEGADDVRYDFSEDE